MVAIYTLYVIFTVTPPVIFTVMNTLSHNMREDALLHNMMVDALLHAEDFAEDFYGRVVDVCKPSGG